MASLGSFLKLFLINLVYTAPNGYYHGSNSALICLFNDLPGLGFVATCMLYLLYCITYSMFESYFNSLNERMMDFTWVLAHRR